MTRQINIYEFRNNDGTVIDRGSAKELSERHFYREATITQDALHEHILDGQYSVVKVGCQEIGTSEVSLKIKEYVENGKKQKEIARLLGITLASVKGRVHMMRVRGVME